MATPSAVPSLERAAVARVPDPAATHVSATLAPRSMAFLAVAIHFNGRPVAGLETHFFRCNDDGTKGAALGGAVVTDSQGIARLARLVPIGHYICEIERQPPTVIPTIHALKGALPLALPIGRHVAEYDSGLDLETHGGSD